LHWEEPMRKWLQDPDTLERLAVEGAVFLESIRGLGQQLVARDGIGSRSARDWLREYDRHERYFWVGPAREEIAGALADRRSRPFLRGPGGAAALQAGFVSRDGKDAAQLA